MRKYLAPLIASLVATGCVADINPNPLNQPITAKPYDGLDPNSYGALSKSRLLYCDTAIKDDPLEASLRESGRDLLAGIYKPIGGATVNDETLIKEDLQDQIKSIGDLVQANVVVLKRDKKGISFWYDLSRVSPEEISNASHKFCAYHKANSTFLGAARRCGRTIVVPSLLKINGQTNPISVTPTYAIARYACG